MTYFTCISTNLEDMLQVSLTDFAAQFLLILEKYKLISWVGYEQASVD